jgi:hypothetical protein
MAKRRAVNPEGSFLGESKPKRVELIAADKRFVIDGKTYRLNRVTMLKGENKEHFSKEIFVAVDENEYRKRVMKIAEFLSEHVHSKDLLFEAMLGAPMSSIEKMERRIAKRAKVKVIRGCYAVKVGDVEIQLVD